MELLEATTDDLDALVDRWYSLAESMESFDDLNELVYADADDVPEDGFRDQFDDDRITDYLIVHDNETIGYVKLREGHHPSRQYSHYLRIVDLYVDEDRRDRGHGADVVERLKEMARDRGCDHLKVSCEWQNEDARRFYRDADFRPKQIEYAQPLK
ncbi:GNAT family N-acetyltransferase [Halorussus marinus]|uniref:GNAT family N-acetyltransferase n=1 Tax=Halorussus marinus TaxID=2505976 RepID=UPI00106EBD4F|nr:GNAT family N-acetyltransferase [Halorussus marinus]